MSNSKLQMSIQYVKGVGPKLAKVLAKLDIRTVEDLLYFIPRDYEDRRQIKKIVTIRPSDLEVVKGEILDIQRVQTRNRFQILKVMISDRTASLQAVWFNQPYLERYFRRGMKLILSGKVEYSNYEGVLQLLVRDFEIDTGDNLPIVPKYHLTEGLYPKKLRQIIKVVLDEYLKAVADKKIMGAIKTLHLPTDLNNIAQARELLAFEELFLFQLGLLLRRKQYKEELIGQAFEVDQAKLQIFLDSLGFRLTTAQMRVLDEILTDLKSKRPMNRLLQGDVGSGKTIVATLAALAVVQNGYQVAILAPTEILAQQHYEKICSFLKNSPVTVNLVTASTNRQNKSREVLTDDIVIGTHALIEEKIRFRQLGLVIVDEQHRFGVEQRAKLVKKGHSPEVLVMTATPIPRSLALILYGDLDRSIIDELPPGRTPIKTYYVPKKKRQEAAEFIRSQVKSGRQIFVVCPLVEESAALDLKAATDEAKQLQTYIYPEFKVGLLHGKLKSQAKDEIMQQFSQKKIDVLVTTTVIEVGIDIPNATVMMIEHAERFGLSQLHQLRGRIGRGGDQSFCFLVAEPKTTEAKARIKVMLETNDGFKIADEDLKLRGPGDFWGVRQSGLPNFRVADIIKDEKIMQTARLEAEALIAKDIESARNCWESQRYKVEVAGQGSEHQAFN